MYWLADGKPADLKAFSEMPMYEYFFLLDKKLAETKKHIARASKTKKNG